MIYSSKGAFLSPCKKYRYLLWRDWNDSLDKVAFIGLNPSTADECIDDPTIRRCVAYAKEWGYGGLTMVNLFAYRSTDPKGLLSVEDPIGPENNAILKQAIRDHFSVAAWGTHGKLLDRERAILGDYGFALHVLGLTKEGHPKHPLYLKKDLKPILWENAMKVHRSKAAVERLNDFSYLKERRQRAK